MDENMHANERFGIPIWVAHYTEGIISILASNNIALCYLSILVVQPRVSAESAIMCIGGYVHTLHDVSRWHSCFQQIFQHATHNIALAVILQMS